MRKHAKHARESQLNSVCLCSPETSEALRSDIGGGGGNRMDPSEKNGKTNPQQEGRNELGFSN